jgi:hypothetical protein
VRAEGWRNARACDPPPRPAVVDVPAPPPRLVDAVGWLLRGVPEGTRVNVQSFDTTMELWAHRYVQARDTTSPGRAASGEIRTSHAYLALEMVRGAGDARRATWIKDRFEAKNRKGHRVLRALRWGVRAGIFERWTARDEEGQARATDIRLNAMPVLTAEEKATAKALIAKWTRDVPWRVESMRVSLRRMKPGRRPSRAKRKRMAAARARARHHSGFSFRENGTTLRGGGFQPPQTGDSTGFGSWHSPPLIEALAPDASGPADSASSRGKEEVCDELPPTQIDPLKPSPLPLAGIHDLADARLADELISHCRAAFGVELELSPVAASALTAAGKRYDSRRGAGSALSMALTHLENTNNHLGVTARPGTTPAKDRVPGCEPLGEQPVADRGSQHDASSSHTPGALEKIALDVLEELDRRNANDANRRAARGRTRGHR